MSTVRIYRVAELLDTTSQEVMALLKRDHGIEVKSASSTIEEVVARQFVERLAKQRGITLPPVAQMFVESPPPAKGKKPTAKAPEPPPKPAAPSLGPPRLIRTITPRPVAPADTAAAPGAAIPHVPFAHEPEPASTPELVGEEPTREPEVEAVFEEPAVPAALAAAGHSGLDPMAGLMAAVAQPSTAEEPAAPLDGEPPVAVLEPAASAATPAADAAVVEAPPARPAPPAMPSGRIVPPTLRLRIEDPSAPRSEGPARPAPVARVPRPPVPTAPQASQPAAVAPPAAARPAVPGAPARPPAPPAAPRTIPGGPRPLPTPPIRPSGPPGTVARPTYQPTGATLRPTYQPTQRPGTPGQPASLRPAQPGMRPGSGPRPGGMRSGQRRDRPDARSPIQAPTPSGPPPVTRTVTLAEGMTVKDLADKLEVRVKDVLKKLID